MGPPLMGLWPSAILQMPTGNAKFQAAADEASCVFLLNAGGAATQVAAYSLLTGNLVVGGLAAATAGIAVYAFAKGCQWDTSGSEFPLSVTLPCCPPLIDPSSQEERWGYRLYRVSTGEEVTVRVGYSSSSNGQYNKMTITPGTWPGVEGSWRLESCGVSYQTTGSLPASFFNPAEFRDIHVVPPINSGCDPSPAPLPPPYTYTDPDDGCQIQVTMLGWGVDAAGNYSPVWQMDPVLPPATARATGGIIGGCNFQPVVYYDGPGGPVLPPVPPAPVPGPGGEPWWLSPLLGALGGATALAIDKALEELFKTPIPQWQYTMRAACNYKEDGTYEDYTITLPEAPYQDRMLQLAETQLDFLQQHLLWKTPTCSSGGQSVAGEPVTVHFVSDERSPDGADYLRKRFVYFDQSGSPLEAHVDHWKDFVWQAGPACVSFEGTPMGKPQVWGADVAEAKRVIAHAAAIAGVDINTGNWLTGTSRNTRYGKPGVMRVARFSNGNFTVTKRPGPSGNPEACG